LRDYDLLAGRAGKAEAAGIEKREGAGSGGCN